MKLLKLDPEVASKSPDAQLAVRALPVHGSLAATAAWRYAQLLSALPKRDTEASAWQHCATFHWEALSDWPSSTKLKDELGPLDILKGGHDESTGMIVDIRCLRGLMQSEEGLEVATLRPSQ